MFKSLAALNIYRDTCPRKILTSMQKRDWKKLDQFHTHIHMIYDQSDVREYVVSVHVLTPEPELINKLN